jgi:hypothetical protein
MGTEGPQTSLLDTIARLCQHCAEEKNGIWLDTVDRVGSHVIDQRKQ